MEKTNNIIETSGSNSGVAVSLNNHSNNTLTENVLTEKKSKETEVIEPILLNAVKAQEKMERQVYGLWISGLLSIVGFIVILSGAKEVGLLAFFVGFAFSLLHAIQIDRCRKFKFKMLSFRSKISDELLKRMKTQCDPKALEDLIKWLNAKK